MTNEEIWTELHKRAQIARTFQDNEDIVAWLESQGINPIEAREMVQFARQEAEGVEITA